MFCVRCLVCLVCVWCASAFVCSCTVFVGLSDSAILHHVVSTLLKYHDSLEDILRYFDYMKSRGMSPRLYLYNDLMDYVTKKVHTYTITRHNRHIHTRTHTGKL